MNRNNKKVIRILLITLALIFFIAVGILSAGYFQLKQVKVVEINKEDTFLGISPSYEEEIEKKYNRKPVNVTNILLLGVDEEEVASDSIIVASIDWHNKKLKMTSIMRDSYVDFEGQSVKKINYAYHYGGPQLAIKTINENYNLNIKDYVKVSFEGLVGVIDAAGGVQINIKDYELPEMRSYGILKAGEYNLTGEQALGYSRIRHVGNYDYERTERQRTILSVLFDKLKSQGLEAYASVMDKMLSYVETSIDKTELVSIGTSILTMGVYNIEQFRLPLDNYKYEVIEDGLFYLKWDKKPNIDAIHKFIYGEDRDNK